MQILGLGLLLIFVLLCFAVIFYWALILQPKAERALAEMRGDRIWEISGLQQFRNQNFALYQIVPTAKMTVAEFRIQDEYGREIGRYTADSRKRAKLEYAGKKTTMYIQGGPFGGSSFAGRVGGTTKDSIVVRDDSHVLAEIWRANVIPPVRYRCRSANHDCQITTAGFWGTGMGSVREGDDQIAAFRRNSLSSRNVFLAFRNDVRDELKLCICSIALLQ
jgi:hypothetical protein